MSPSGKKIAVASFQGKSGGWEGEIENLKTNIFVMNVDKPFDRKLVVTDGGWPTWGSDDVIFFHRKIENSTKSEENFWGVFRADISKILASKSSPPITDAPRVTPVDIDAFTPAAISETKVAVATIRKKSKFSDVRVEDQYRHIEIFEYSPSGVRESTKITRFIRPKADHFNPFLFDGIDETRRIGYHRCKSDLIKVGTTANYHFEFLN